MTESTDVAGFAGARAALAEGRARAARELIAPPARTSKKQGLTPTSADDVLVAAEVFAATGAFRRGQALLRWGLRRFDCEALRVAVARAELGRGLWPDRRVRNLLEKQPSPAAALLRARVEGKAPPAVAAGTDVDVDVDLALAAFATDPTRAVQVARDALTRAPASARTRVVLASLLRAQGHNDDGRALLKEGSRAFEDARVELALALALVADGRHDEANLAVSRLRARFFDLARDRSLRLVLIQLAWVGGRNDDAAAFVTGATDPTPAERAAAALLAPPTTLPTATPPTTAATSATAGTAAATTATATNTTEPANDSPAATATTPTTTTTTTTTTTGKPTPPARERPKTVVAEVPLFDADISAPAAWRQPLAALMLVGCAAFVVWRVWFQPPPPVVVDAGVVVAREVPVPPRVPGEVFKGLAAGCGVAIPGFVDVGVTPMAVAAQVNGSPLEGGAVNVGITPFALDEDLVGRAGVSALSLGVGGRLRPALLTDNKGLVVGYGLLAAEQERARLGDVAPGPRFSTSAQAPCPGHPELGCRRAEVRCPGVTVAARIVCANATTAQAACGVEALVVLDDNRPISEPVAVAPVVVDAGTKAVGAGVVDAGVSAVVDAGPAPVVGVVDAGRGAVDAGASNTGASGAVDAGVVNGAAPQ